MLSLTVKGKEASVAAVPMTADSQLRDTEGFFESLSQPPHPQHPLKKQSRQETIEENS